MYSELIYTRCGQGVDILKGGSPITNAGFKVFTCSSDVLQGEVADVALLQNVAQRKEPFSDPTFMDDAYVYMTPDYGGKFIVNFHPVPFDRNATGDYAHRPGNFINQIFVGSFGDFYPYETFGNDSLWDAQKRSEAYYYETKPTQLESRKTLTTSKGKITTDAIAQFVADGRREALMSAIAFVVSQFALPLEKRKSLVIKDANSENIELWIAAIERAFSPRMASGLSFATRLDDFVNSNQYVVDLGGKFTPQADLENAGTRLRRRAMIVGVDERDKNNTAAARTTPYLPFVVLDGKSKSPLVNIDYSHPYYRCVTNYEQKRGASFCEGFLQTLNVASPTPKVLQLYDAFESLADYKKNRQFDRLAHALTVIGQFPLINTPFLEGMYFFVKNEIIENLNNETLFSVVIPWIEHVSEIVGDESRESIKQYIDRTTCSGFVENIFKTPSAEKTDEIYRVVSKSAFGTNAAKLLTSQETIEAFQHELAQYKTKDWLCFSRYFIDSLRSLDTSSPKSLDQFLRLSVATLGTEQNGKNALDLVSLYAGQNFESTKNILLEEAQKAAERKSQARVKTLLQLTTSLIPTSSLDDFNNFYTGLKKYQLESYIGECLTYKAHLLDEPQKEEILLQWAIDKLGNKPFIALILSEIDKRLNLSNEGNEQLASLIQKTKSENFVYPNSAHIYALEVFESDETSASRFTAIVEGLTAQGFPSIENATFANRMLDKLSKSKLPNSVVKAILISAEKSDFYTQFIAKKTIDCLGSNQKNFARQILLVAVEIHSSAFRDALANALSEADHFKKCVSNIKTIIKTRDTQQRIRNQVYLKPIIKESKSKRQDQRPSILSRLFSKRREE